MNEFVLSLFNILSYKLLNCFLIQEFSTCVMIEIIDQTTTSTFLLLINTYYLNFNCFIIFQNTITWKWAFSSTRKYQCQIESEVRGNVVQSNAFWYSRNRFGYICKTFSYNIIFKNYVDIQYAGFCLYTTLKLFCAASQWISTLTVFLKKVSMSLLIIESVC